MAIATRVVTYDDQETALTGFLAWDDAERHPMPGLLLVHGGAGLDDHAKARRSVTSGMATQSWRVTCSGMVSPVIVSA